MVRWIAVILMWAGSALAAPLEIEVAGVGEVVAQDVGEAKLLPGNLAGVAGVLGPRLVRPGYQIDGVYCHQFGFSFRATNLPADEAAPIMVQVDHPQWALPDGRTGTVEAWLSGLQGNRWGYVGYSFTEAWSLVPGPWVFTLRQGTTVLTRQSFEIEVAPGQAMPAEGCAASVS